MSPPAHSSLSKLPTSTQHAFYIPSKKINDGDDVTFWLTSYAYTDLMTFILQLNASMFPRKTNESPGYHVWTLQDPASTYSPTITHLRTLIEKLSSILDEVPPDPGPRRFGNVSFRKWYALVEERIDVLLEDLLPSQVLSFPSCKLKDTVSPKEELKTYLLGSFGSSQRLDYGTGHELSFLAFLGGLWKLGAFKSDQAEWGLEERGIVLGVVESYLNLIRKLILTYTLEPAGSHGVWGLDDHSFISYIFGSAQLSPAISSPQDIPTEGSIEGAPRPGDVTKTMTIERERKVNMYFSAIGFIYDVKSGPFWEHSPILFDISGVMAGWAKINKGMIKMYNAEVLGKFPVVQHFPFGSLFRWERNPDAASPVVSTHTTSQPSRQAVVPPPTARPMPGRQAGTQAPWVNTQAQRIDSLPGPKTSWTGQSSAPGLPATRAPWAGANPRLPPLGATATLPARGDATKMDELRRANQDKT